MPVQFPFNLRPPWYKVGSIEDDFGAAVLVRFGKVVVQVPAERLVPADE